MAKTLRQALSENRAAYMVDEDSSAWLIVIEETDGQYLWLTGFDHDEVDAAGRVTMIHELSQLLSAWEINSADWQTQSADESFDFSMLASEARMLIHADELEDMDPDEIEDID